jgi:hypothetical protein
MRNESRSFASVFAVAMASQMTPKSPRSRSVGRPSTTRIVTCTGKRHPCRGRAR